MNPSRPQPPSHRPSPNRNDSSPQAQGWKRRLVFSPDGDIREQYRVPRTARPGRNERDAIRRGERPFFGRGPGNNAAGSPPKDRPASSVPLATQRNFREPLRRAPSVPHPNVPTDDRFPRPDPARRNFVQPPRDSSVPTSGPFASVRTWRPTPNRGFVGPNREGPGRPDFRGTGGPRAWQDRSGGGERPRRPDGAQRPGFSRPGSFRDRQETAGRTESSGEFHDRSHLLSAPTLGGPVQQQWNPRHRHQPSVQPISVEALAIQVIQRANAEVPADAALRSVLKNARGLSPVEAEAVSAAVFQHYRWFGWLDAEGPVEARLEHAAELASRFVRDPASFSDADLRSHTVPEWAWLQVEAPPGWPRNLQTAPRLWLRAHPRHANKLSSILQVRPGPFPGSFLYGGSEDLFVHPSFQAGEFEIQDLASQAVGLVCDPKPTETWWDACAGEGGKTLHLSALMDGKGMIWASDRAEWRLERLRRRTARAHCFNYRANPWDGGEKPPTRTEFDGILVDAPCSGVGTWGRNPHARWTTTPADVQELAALQRRLLTHARGSLKPGGRLIYAVCTLTRAETMEISDWFSSTFVDEFETLPFRNPFALETSPASPLTLWPGESGGNGMFIAAWKKKAA